MTSDHPRVAVSGLGSIGVQHVRALAAAGVTDIVVFDPSEPLRRSALRLPGVTQALSSVDALLDAGADAVVIAAPDRHHLDQLAATTSLGIPTLVEKPLAEARSAAVAARPGIVGTGTPVVVGYVLRHRRIMRTAHDLLTSGAIGTPTSFQVMLGAYGTITAAASRFDRPEPDRLYRDYSHEWDYLRWLLGPIERILAVARTTREVPHVEQPNLVDGLIEVDSGVVGAFHLDYVEPRGTRTLHVVGTGGTLFADIAAGTVSLRAAADDHDRSYSQPESPGVSLTRQAEHLLAVARGEAAPMVDLDDGIAALAVADAARRSATSGHWADVGTMARTT